MLLYNWNIKYFIKIEIWWDCTLIWVFVVIIRDLYTFLKTIFNDINENSYKL